MSHMELIVTVGFSACHNHTEPHRQEVREPGRWLRGSPLNATSQRASASVTREPSPRHAPPLSPGGAKPVSQHHPRGSPPSSRPRDKQTSLSMRTRQHRAPSGRRVLPAPEIYIPG